MKKLFILKWLLPKKAQSLHNMFQQSRLSPACTCFLRDYVLSVQWNEVAELIFWDTYLFALHSQVLLSYCI